MVGNLGARQRLNYSVIGDNVDLALAKLDALQDMMALRDYVDEGPVGKRRLPLLSKKDLADDEDAPEASDDEDEDEELFSSNRRLVEPPDFDLIEE